MVDDDDIIEVYSASGPEITGSQAQTEADRAALALNDAMQEHGGEATVTVYLQKGSGKDAMQFVEDAPADLRTLSQWQNYLKEQYGGGFYRFHLRKEGRLVQNKLIAIAEGKTTMPANPVNGGGEISAVLNTMLAMQERQTQMIAQLAAPKDSMAEMQKMLAMMTAMREAMGITPQQQATTAPDFGAIISKSMESMTALFDFQANMMEMKKEIIEANPKTESEESNLIGLLKEFAPQVLELVKTEQGLKTLEMQHKTIGEARKANPAPRSAVEKPAPVPAPVNPVFKMLGEKLLPYASDDADPIEVAAQLYSMFGAEKIGPLLQGKPLAEMMRSFPPMRAHMDWASELLLELRGLLDDALTDDAGAGDTSDTAATVETDSNVTDNVPITENS